MSYYGSPVGGDKLTQSVPGMNPVFAIDGAFIALTSKNKVLIYDSTSLSLTQELEYPDYTPEEAVSNGFGEALAVKTSGTNDAAVTVFIGVPGGSRVLVVSLDDAGDWSDWITLEGVASTKFGASLAAVGRDWVAVGAPGDGLGEGAVHLYHAVGGVWVDRVDSADKVLHPNPDRYCREFGMAVASDGVSGVVIGGAPSRQSSVVCLAPVYRLGGAGGWTLEQELGEDEGEWREMTVGTSLSMSPGRIGIVSKVTGGHGKGTVYQRNEAGKWEWFREMRDVGGPFGGDVGFGESISVSRVVGGSYTFAVSAPRGLQGQDALTGSVNLHFEELDKVEHVQTLHMPDAAEDWHLFGEHIEFLERPTAGGEDDGLFLAVSAVSDKDGNGTVFMMGPLQGWYCGDNKRQAGEDCDTGSDNGAAYSACDSECIHAECGNGKLQKQGDDGYGAVGENCDDGWFDRDGDGCSDYCNFNPIPRRVEKPSWDASWFGSSVSSFGRHVFVSTREHRGYQDSASGFVSWYEYDKERNEHYFPPMARMHVWGGEDSTQRFGASICADGESELIAIGAPAVSAGKGNVFLYAFSDLEVVGGVESNSVGFGEIVALRGDVLVVGAPTKSRGGGDPEVFVYQPNSAGKWKLVQELDLPVNSSRVWSPIGGAIEIGPEKQIAIGNLDFGDQEGGSWPVVVYELGEDGKWALRQKIWHPDLGAEDPADRRDLARFGVDLGFGAGGRLLIGWPGLHGKVYSYEKDNGYELKQEITARRVVRGDSFGAQVEVIGSRLAVSAPSHAYNHELTGFGTVHMYELHEGQWIPTAQLWTLSAEEKNSFGSRLARGSSLGMGMVDGAVFVFAGTKATPGNSAQAGYFFAVDCGNGHLDAYEHCDDGNNIAGDGCDPECVSEVCGNGKIQFGEYCDPPDAFCSPWCRPYWYGSFGELLAWVVGIIVPVTLVIQSVKLRRANPSKFSGGATLMERVPLVKVSRERFGI